MTYTTDISPDILAAGRWVQGRWGVLRWVAAPPEAAPEPRAGVIVCPTCRATATETCKTARGNITKDHKERTAARQCPCGADVARFKNYCEPCRVEARRVTWRNQAQKKRALDECAQRRQDAADDMYGGAA